MRSFTGRIFLNVGYTAILILLFAGISWAANRLVYETFEDRQWNDSFDGTFNPANVSLVSFGSARSGNYVARMYGGSLGGAFDYRINAGINSEIYIKYYQYFPPGDWNWSNISKTGLKQLRFGPGQGDGWPIQTFKSDGMAPHTHGYYSEGGHPSEIRTRYFFPSGSFPSLGTWHKVEVYAKYSNTVGGYWWKIDDVRVAGSDAFVHDVWPPPWGNIINTVRFAGGNGFPSGDFYYVDDVEIWDGLPDAEEPIDDPVGPPNDVANFTATSGDGQVTLSWTNPTDADFKGTMVRYSTGEEVYPTSHSVGTLVCDKQTPPGSSDGFTITGLENGIKYNFSAFTYDETGNYSETAYVSATPIASGPPSDTIDPTVTITQPISGSTYSTDQSSITLGGTASDNVDVTSVTWQNDRGDNGTASGTTIWTISNISLQEGDNVISVTAHDAAGNSSTDAITVSCTYTPPPGTYTKEFGSATGADYPGALEDTFINLNEDKTFASEYLNTYTWPDDTVANAIIIKSDLSTMPSSAVIQDATLSLYLSGAGGDELYDLSVHKIINHKPDLSQCDGYTYDGTNSWTPNNSCYNDIPLAQADIVQAEDSKSIDTTAGYKSWNITNMVREWIANPDVNFGLLLNSDSIASSNSNRTFFSSDSSDSNQRPKLEITYTLPGGTETAPAAPTGTVIIVE